MAANIIHRPLVVNLLGLMWLGGVVGELRDIFIQMDPVTVGFFELLHRQWLAYPFMIFYLVLDALALYYLIKPKKIGFWINLLNILMSYLSLVAIAIAAISNSTFLQIYVKYTQLDTGTVQDLRVLPGAMILIMLTVNFLFVFFLTGHKDYFQNPKNKFVTTLLSEKQIKTQVDGYKKLKFSQSYRGQAFLMLIALFTLGLFVVGLTQPEKFWAGVIGVLVLYCPALFFMYKGKKWAMIAVFVAYLLLRSGMSAQGSQAGGIVGILILYMLYRPIEVEQMRTLKKA